jgi:membrane protein
MYLGHSAIASTYGAAGSFVLILVWIYYSSMILLFGAEFTAIRTGKLYGSVQPKPGAVRVSREVKLHPEHAAS